MITYHPSVIRKRVYTRKSLDERFWQYVQKTDGCWLWTGNSKHSFGYGLINMGGKNGKIEAAHRVSWIIHNGAIHDGMCILHHCDNPLCVRPEHLFIGTRDDNNKDMKRKGRYAVGCQCKGEQHGMAKLTEAKVRAIRADYDAGGMTCKAIGAKHGVSLMNVWQIGKRKTWSHLL